MIRAVCDKYVQLQDKRPVCGQYWVSDKVLLNLIVYLYRYQFVPILVKNLEISGEIQTQFLLQVQHMLNLPWYHTLPWKV